VVARLRGALADAEFTVSGVTGLIGPDAHQALARNETTPALRRSRDGSPLATLTRLWLLQAPVARESLDVALPGLVGLLVSAGVLEHSGAEVRALVDVRPYAEDDTDWWIVSDLTPGLDGAARRMRPDHVLGVASSSTSLAQLTIREDVGRALDLGTGSGVQALHLTRHAGDVVATDVSTRCVQLAELTFGLNGVNVDLRSGDLYEPVADDTFDLIVSNPPFVISPGTGERLVYRDSGLPSDEMVRRVATGSVDHLNDHGWCQVLANWVHHEDEPWTQRVGGWLTDTGCDAWVVQRGLMDVAQYVAMWLNDAGLRGDPDYVSRYDAWLSWFEEQRIEAIGFGWLNLHKAGRAKPVMTLEEWPYDVEQAIGPHVAAWGRQVDAREAYADDALLLSQRLHRADDVVEERTGVPGEEDPRHIVLRQQRGLRRAREVSTTEAAFFGACDGDLTVGQIADALAVLMETDPGQVRAEVVTAARELLLTGFIDV
jgi:SAM-dependent methyltransferase